MWASIPCRSMEIILWVHWLFALVAVQQGTRLARRSLNLHGPVDTTA